MKTEVPPPVKPVQQPQQMPNQTLEMQPKANRKPLIIISLALIVLLLTGFVVVKGKKSSDTISEESTFAGLPEADKNITVELTSIETQKKYKLTVSKIPKDVTSIEYEMQYKSVGEKRDKIEGVYGTVAINKGETSFTREVIIGTASSGVIRYHILADSKAILTFKFVAPSGASRLQKDFKLY